MNKNVTNPGFNVEDYENMAVEKSNTAKRVAAGAAIFAGGAAVAGGAAYAAGQTGESELSEEDVMGGADVSTTYHEEVKESQQVVTEEKPVVVEEEPVQEEGLQWQETTEVYINGEKVGSIESGEYKGNDFAIYDLNGDNRADALSYDVNGDGQYQDNEYQLISDSENIYMGHETAHTTSKHYINGVESEDYAKADGTEPIHNDFSDEKTGESYSGDWAENNPDYNPDADTDNYQTSVENDYLAENDDYQDDSTNYGCEDFIV